MKLIILLVLFLADSAAAALLPTPVTETIPARGYQVAGSGGAGSTVVSYTPSTDQLLCVRVSVSVTTTDTITVRIVYTRATDGVAQTVTIIDALDMAVNTDDSASHCLNAKANTSVTVKLISASTTKASSTILRDK